MIFAELTARIVADVSLATGVPVDAILGRCRQKPIVAARHEAWRRLRAMELSYPAIAFAFDVDHTTVMYACSSDMRARHAARARGAYREHREGYRRLGALVADANGHPVQLLECGHPAPRSRTPRWCRNWTMPCAVCFTRGVEAVT